MDGLEISGRRFDRPVFVPSISSYESQIPPVSAVELQLATDEPITLVSSFDLHENDDLLEITKVFQSEGGIVLADSGGYEHSRYNFWSHCEWKWGVRNYKKVSLEVNPDLIFSYDLFPEEHDSPAKYALKLAALLDETSRDLDLRRIIPVLHLQPRRGRSIFDAADAAEISTSLLQRFPCCLVAIPERELGEGLHKRAKSVREIARAIDIVRPNGGLHVLGCGNPLAIAFMADAGVSIVDGLEWCRTTISTVDWHLHHHQHLEAFEVSPLERSEKIDYLLQTRGGYYTKWGLHNLQGFRRLMENIRQSIADNSLRLFVERNYGKKAAELFDYARL
ncbi:hypothetical protein [Mesorhizobium sp. M0030]|uniref:hypothetical protein n=1 Tax=Mesorhizobium sp. M0030 TaxID=2956851 RepID=UPI00333726A3